jgi:chromosome partitioning protein
MIITTGGIKGGSGKTTVSTNLAVYLASKGRDVLFIDADDQESAYQFSMQRESVKGEGGTGYTAIRQKNKEVRSEVLKLVGKFDDIIIDTGGRDTASQRAALSVTNVYLVPFYPRGVDAWTLPEVEKLVSEMQASNPDLKAFSFINRADPQSADNREVAQFLRESEILQYIDTPLINRKAFSNATTAGLGIMEYKPTDSKAQSEFAALYSEIFKLLNIKEY